MIKAGFASHALAALVAAIVTACGGGTPDADETTVAAAPTPRPAIAPAPAGSDATTPERRCVSGSAPCLAQP